MNIRRLFYLLIYLLMFNSCRYGEAVRNETRIIFEKHKNFMIKIAFCGSVENKNICESCNINTYTLTLKIKLMSNDSLIRNDQYPPYYSFYNDSMLTISVSKELFENVLQHDNIKKNSESLYLEINSIKYPYLNKEKYEWLPQ